MATAEVQHPVPTAVHDDGTCFQEEEENHKVPVQQLATEVLEGAPCAEEVQVHANGVAEEETMKGVQDEGDSSDKENDPKDHHEDEAADGPVQAVAQEVEAKLGIVQDDEVVAASAAADNEAKPPKVVEAEAEPRREVPRKAAGAAKSVVVPVDDDDDDGLLIDGKAAAPAPAEAPAEKEDDEEADKKDEELPEEKPREE